MDQTKAWMQGSALEAWLVLLSPYNPQPNPASEVNLTLASTLCWCGWHATAEAHPITKREGRKPENKFAKQFSR